MANLNYQNPDEARREAVAGWRQKIFGVSRADAWSALAREIDARFEEGGWWKRPRVVADVGHWQFTLDVYHTGGENSSTYTRLRAPFHNPSGFRFHVYRASIFTGLGKLLGMQDVEIGEAGFDEDFVVRSNDEATVRAMLASPEIRRLLTAQPRVMFQVKDDEGWFGPDFPPGVDELHFLALGVIKDVDRLKRLFELFSQTLYQLVEMKVALAVPARVKF